VGFKGIAQTGSQVGAQRQQTAIVPLFPMPLVAAGDSNLIPAAGFNGAITIELDKTGAFDPDFEVFGTLDSADEVNSNTVWCPVRYVVLGTGGALTPVDGTTAFAGDPDNVFIAVLDSFATLKVTITAGPGVFSLTGRALLTPQ
jgi:hypothetical protein